GQERTKALGSHPEVERVLYTVTGQSRARQAIDLMLGTFRGVALDDSQGWHAVLIEQLLVLEQTLPDRVANLAAQTRGFTVVIVGDALDGLAICRHGNEGIHGGPQTLAINWQNDVVDLALRILGEEHRDQPGDLTQTSLVIGRCQTNAFCRVFRCQLGVEVVGIAVNKFTGSQVNQTRFNLVTVQLGQITLGHTADIDTGNGQDIA